MQRNLRTKREISSECGGNYKGPQEVIHMSQNKCDFSPCHLSPQGGLELAMPTPVGLDMSPWLQLLLALLIDSIGRIPCSVI